MRLLPKSTNVTLPIPGCQAGKRSEGSFIRRKNEILPPAKGGTQNDTMGLSNSSLFYSN